MDRIRLLLLDDHVLFREGMRRLLASEADFEIAAESGNPQEVLDLLGRIAVDVVLLDFDLETEVGTRFIATARSSGYSGKILMVTAGMSPVDAAVARKLGISGIFLKHNPPRLLIDAIRSVSAGGEWIDPKFGTTAERESLPRESSYRLTPREKKVLSCVFEGLSNKEMAFQLGVSQSSIKATLQQLFDKTGVRTRGQLVRIAIERELETVRGE